MKMLPLKINWQKTSTITAILWSATTLQRLSSPTAPLAQHREKRFSIGPRTNLYKHSSDHLMVGFKYHCFPSFCVFIQSSNLQQLENCQSDDDGCNIFLWLQFSLKIRTKKQKDFSIVARNTNLYHTFSGFREGRRASDGVISLADTQHLRSQFARANGILALNQVR